MTRLLERLWWPLYAIGWSGAALYAAHLPITVWLPTWAVGLAGACASTAPGVAREAALYGL